MIVMASLTTVFILALWLPAASNSTLVAFAVLFGVGSGAGIGLTPALCAQISPIRDIGIRTGAAFAFSSFAALTGSPIGGQIIGASHGSFKYMILFAGVSCAIGTALFIATRVVLAGVKPIKV